MGRAGLSKHNSEVFHYFWVGLHPKPSKIVSPLYPSAVIVPVVQKGTNPLSSAVFSPPAARIPTAIYTSVDEEGALRWSGGESKLCLQGSVLSPASALSNLIVSPSDNRLGLHPASPNALLRSQSFHTAASLTPAVLTVSCTCGSAVSRRYRSPQTPGQVVRLRGSQRPFSSGRVTTCGGHSGGIPLKRACKRRQRALG